MSYNKLRGKIKEVFGTQEAFAKAMDIDVSTMSQKLNGKSGFSQMEILKACELLKISMKEMPSYFFILKV